ncbi:MAG TPA: hypothetical protein DEP38_11985, partial [Cyanobacteria bacterium UBA9226]|nr:hypothetical protein [Cyanobacteria bacterium UBA9226]
KSKILSPVAQLAHQIPGYPLLTVIIGKDPINGASVSRNSTNLIRGIFSLVPGGDNIFNNLQQSGAIDKAFNWFNSQITKLNLTWETIKGLFKQAWDSLGMSDILSPSGALEKIKNIFIEPIGRIKNFAVSASTKVMEFVFEGVMGAGGAKVMGIIKNAGGAFNNILKDPIAFCGNLVGAIRGGFQKFSGNIATHLKNGLTGWLFGALAGAGLTLPAQFDLKGIVSIVLQVVGATYNKLRGKLVNKIGEGKVGKLEKTFDFIKGMVTGGLVTAWQKIAEFTGNLQEMVMGGIKEWVKNSIIGAAITKLISMFNPAGAIVQAVMAIYNTVMFFIERGAQIAALGEAVFSSIGSIAAGNIGAAANYVEQTMGRTLPVVISFLARLMGLGGISEQIKSLIKRVQGKVEDAVSRVVDFVVEKGKSLLGGGEEITNKPNPDREDNNNNNLTGQNRKDPEHDKQVTTGLNQIDREETNYLNQGKIAKEDAEKIAKKVKQENPIFKSITVVDGGETWDYRWIASEGIKKGEKKTESIVQKQLEIAKQHFQDQTFTDEQLATAIGENRRTAVRRIKDWKKIDCIYEAGKDLYTFEPEKAIGTPLERAKQRFQQASFTSQQLADELGEQLRTAQRYIKDWLEESENIGLYRVPTTRDRVAFDPSLKPSVTQQQGIHKSKYVDPKTWEILPEYRKEMRDRFYKKNYRDIRLTEILTPAYAGQDSNGNSLYHCYYTDSPELQGPNHKDVAQHKKGKGEIDHITDVAEHWENEGNNMTQAERNKWYDDPSNLRFLCESCNRAKKGKPSRTFSIIVGRDFRGPNEKV